MTTLKAFRITELVPKSRVLLAVKLATLAIFIVGTNEGIGKRSLVGYAFFFAAWLLSMISILHVAFYSGIISRAVWSVVLVSSTVVGRAVQVIFDAPMTLADFDRHLGNIGDANTVLPFYGRILAWPLLFSAMGLVAINLPPFSISAKGPRDLRRRAKELALQVSPLVVMVLVLFMKHGEGTNGLAVQHTSYAFLATLGIERLMEGPRPQREEVTMPHSGERPLRNIIVVMDESIRGDLLDINREDGAVTGLKGRPDLVNFGVMSSIANCSHESNVSFRYGIGRTDYLRQLAVHPSIWAYAKKAGYETYYYDAQRNDGELHNGMDKAELALIGTHFYLGPDDQPQDRDVKTAKALRKMLDEKKDQPKFVYVNKMGSHFPYEGKYPPDKALRTPVMKRDYFGNETDPSAALRKWTKANVVDDEQRRRFKNSYHNAVSWNASQFFGILLPGLDLSDTLIVYMADHGQDFRDDGRPGMSTHCTNGDAHPDEGRVPFAVLTTHEPSASELRAAQAINHNRLSQFSVFPTVLRWMGYSAEAVASQRDFDPTIFEPPAKDNQRFLSTYFVRLGGKPVWNSCVNYERSASN